MNNRIIAYLILALLGAIASLQALVNPDTINVRPTPGSIGIGDFEKRQIDALNGEVGIGDFEKLQQIKPIQLLNQQQFDAFLAITRKLNKHVVKRQGMGLSRGDITLGTFGNQRVVLQTL